MMLKIILQTILPFSISKSRSVSKIGSTNSTGTAYFLLEAEAVKAEAKSNLAGSGS
jgi:hypothetical protein